MDGQSWKVKRINEIMGMPHLNAEYLPPGAIIGLKEGCERIEGLGALVLFGSVIRGEASPRSDIDVMAVPLGPKQPERLRKDIAGMLTRIEREHTLKASFSLLVNTGKEDPYFLWEAAKDGAVIFCRPEMVVRSEGELRPYALISYSLGGAGAGPTKRVQRFFFEQKTGAGLKRSNRLECIGPGVILVALEKSKRITELLDRLKIRYGLVKVWR